MAFASAEDVMNVVESRLIKKIWKDVLDIELPEAFPRLTYEQAMLRFGSDKPDLRIPIEIHSNIQSYLPQSFVDAISSTPNPAVDLSIIPLHTDPGTARSFAAKCFDTGL